MARNDGVVAGVVVFLMILYLIGSLILDVAGISIGNPFLISIGNPFLRFLAAVLIVFANQLFVFIIGTAVFLTVYCLCFSFYWLIKRLFASAN
ncbi:MAG: hypothetical protein HYX20_04390 [Candidatus Yanofskybacteria bacterium]|nr:hypothetical protein [Candidatus Yanofskybacteria bacterium]